ncbi:hypothetical protein BDZ89DRAFT_1127998 [Hymenopellis radicata]|nr:hypothetical protein BDZ89DRAFT_1127998 [Hymenopellis radicata]
MSDSRFSRLRSDPRFRRPKKAKSKVVVDERFKSVFAQEKKSKNKSAGRVDKYGRPLSASHEQDNLRRFYRIEDEDEIPDEPKLPDYARGQVLLESSDEEDASKAQDDSDESDIDGFVSVGLRGEHSDVEIDLDESQTAELSAQAAAYSQEHPQIEEGDRTRRIAVVNLDWDHVRAKHLYKICSSLVSPTAPSSRAGSSRKATTSQVRGQVKSVRVYPSDFGKERMAREEKEGPPAELFKTKSDSKEEALRKYQLERLRYYYAVIECDSVDTALIYTMNWRGLSWNALQMCSTQFHPDEMTFENPFRDEATEDTGTQTKSLDFVTDALRHSKVKLTWTRMILKRNQVTRRPFSRKEIEEDNFQTYLASSSSDSEQDEDRPKKGDRKAQSRNKLRALLLGGNDAMPEGWARDEDGDAGSDVDMEITFTPRKMKEKRKQRVEQKKGGATKGKDEELEGDDFFDADSEEDLVEKPLKTNKAGKEKERIPQDLSHLVDEEDDGKHFDLKAILKAEKKSKRKGKKSKDAAPTDETQPDFSIDVADSRFSVLHEDPTFAIDPSNPQFKKTKSMSALLEEGGKRRQKKRGEDGTATTPTSSTGSGRKLESLVESVKRKSMVQGQKGNGKRQRLS